MIAPHSPIHISILARTTNSSIAHIQQENGSRDELPFLYSHLWGTYNKRTVPLLHRSKNL